MELEALADVAAPPRPLPGLARGTPAHPLRAASARPAPPAIESMTLGAARGAFLATLKPSTLPKTPTIKKTAIEALVAFLGAKAKVHAVTRSDLLVGIRTCARREHPRRR